MTNDTENTITPLSSQDSIPFPDNVPVLLSNDPVVFPHMIAPIVIRGEIPRLVVDEVIKGNRLIGIFPTKSDEVEEHSEENDGTGEHFKNEDFFPTGTLCSVLRMLKIPDGTVRLLVHGITRVSFKGLIQTKPYPTANISRLLEIETEDVEVEALKKQMIESLQTAISLANMPEDLAVAAINVEEGGKLADLVASNINLRPRDLREVLAEVDTKKRLTRVFELLSREVRVMEIGNNISEQVRDSVDKSQREFFLREQIRVMQNELGESDPHEREMAEMRERLDKKAMPDHARQVAERELGRLIHLQPAAAEYSVIRTYLEWILDLPWVETTDDHLDIDRAARVLDEDHYGLQKVKERILEFLAVIRLKQGNLKGPILCFVGPPGVGKTSLGRSIARATGRNFTRFSLGGMRDEAEIRGHRRTYIGAMPGRIIKALKDCGTVNPLIMLDEIDKLGADFRGDPASALLEVLDPEQNDTFNDHYMDMPVDLSKVMFITTANSLDTIPAPLRDRMEIIRIAGYMPIEKLEIAKRYLVPREIENTGLSRKHISFHAPALRRMITDYTAEAGVRSLQKEISKICRKVARSIAEQESRAEVVQAEKAAKKNSKKPSAAKKKKPVIERTTVTADSLESFLGQPTNLSDVAERMGRPGIAIGLAWTPVGGDILFVEASRFPGKGELKLTGQLGDVMKESANAALTFLRANLDLLGLEDDVFSRYNFHVHVPAGATPKDGPSAGVSMTAALASLVTGKHVRDFLAMTGEISLRGNILPVGGIKEKCLAAHRAGIKEICLPTKNKRDLEEIPAPIRKAVKFHFLDRIEELLNIALVSDKKSPAKATRTTAPRKTATRRAART